MKLIDLKQNTTQWLEYRKNRIGASDVPVIMGVSKWRTPLQLWKSMLSVDEPEKQNWFKDSIKQNGHDLEPYARNAFEKKIGCIVIPTVVQHDFIDHYIASLDGYGIEQSGHTCVVEIKCPGKEDHELAKTGSIPTAYYPQLQWQLFITGLPYVYYYSYINDNDNVLIGVNKDQQYIKQMLSKVEDFWNCLQTFTPPEMTDRDYQVKNDHTWNAHAAEWKSAKKQLKYWEEKEKEIKNVLINLAEGQSTCGAGLKATKYNVKGRIDYESIAEFKNIDLEKYRKPLVEAWRISEV